MNRAPYATARRGKPWQKAIPAEVFARARGGLELLSENRGGGLDTRLTLYYEVEEHPDTGRPVLLRGTLWAGNVTTGQRAYLEHLGGLTPRPVLLRAYWIERGEDFKTFATPFLWP